MDMLNRFSQRTALCGCALLLCFSLNAGADELQDIGKLFKQGKQEQALTRVNTYLEQKPKDAQARFLKGLILTEQDKTADAIKVFTGLTEDYPELPEPYNNLAVLYANQGQYDKARSELEMAIRTNPSYATAHENLGDIYAKMASQAYDRALQLDHSNASTKTKLAMIKEIFASGNVKEVQPAEAAQPQAAAPAAAQPAAVAAAATTTTASAQQAPAQASPAPAPAAAKPAAAHKPPHNSKDVLKVVHAWAAAWSKKDVKDYLKFYADDFKTPDNMSRSDWEAQRHERLTKPRYIKIGISHARVWFLDATHARATFREHYRASHMRSTSDKTLELVWANNGWLIQEERSGK